MERYDVAGFSKTHIALAKPRDNVSEYRIANNNYDLELIHGSNIQIDILQALSPESVIVPGTPDVSFNVLWAQLMDAVLKPHY